MVSGEKVLRVEIQTAQHNGESDSESEISIFSFRCPILPKTMIFTINDTASVGNELSLTLAKVLANFIYIFFSFKLMDLLVI